MDVQSVSGQAVQRTHHHQQQSPVDHIRKMEQQIDQGVQLGKLISDQAAAMKRELNGFQAAIQLQRAANGGRWAADQRQQVARQLHQLSRSLHAALNSSALTEDSVLSA